MGSIYDKNTVSQHGPWGNTGSVHHGPYGNKDNQDTLSAKLPGEKNVSPVEKPDRQE